jgi:hypothetical protein
MENKRNNNYGQWVNNAKEAYECKVAVESLDRAGKCNQLKGVVHEVLVKDKMNANIGNLCKGKITHLTKSNTAQVNDLITMQGNKVVGRYQLKDVVSPSGVSKTVKQINSGKYGKTSILGTEETVAKLAGKTKQKVHSSGISSDTTSRIANKALGKMPNMNALHAAGKAGGVAGAAVSAGVETVTSLYDVYKGKKDIGEAAGDIAVAGIKGGVTGYGSAVAGSAAAGATGAVIASSGIGATVAAGSVGALAVAAAPAAVGFAAACAVGSLISSFFDD